jgi:hypothetical protein
VHPIRSIDGRPLARVAGEATVAVMECFAALVAERARADRNDGSDRSDRSTGP